MTVQRQRGEITVRPFARSDISSLYSAIRSSIDSLSRSLPWCHAGYSLHDAEQWVDHCLESWSANAEFPLGIFNAAGVVIGGTGLNHVNRAYNMASIGYWVSEAHRGTGIASTAAGLAAEIGFNELGFTRLEIVVLPENVASNKVARKIGATLEAEARNRILFKGRTAGAFVYSLVPEDIVGG
ncbi:MAG: GNAT family N-acetyltransferase [Lysobacter sp.]|nr:GNAT family N-acetyltransferase [Lysobacter sp.]